MNTTYNTFKELSTYATDADYKLLEETVTLPLWGELTGVKPSKLHEVKPPKKSTRYRSGGTAWNRYQYLKNLVRNLFEYYGGVHVLLGNDHFTQKQKTGTVPAYYTRSYARWVLDKLCESGNAEMINGTFNTHAGSTATEVLARGALLERLKLARWMHSNAITFNDGEQGTDLYTRVPEELRAYLPQSYVTTDMLKMSTKRKLMDDQEVRLTVACPRTPSLDTFVDWMSNLEKSYIERGVTFSYTRASDGEIVTPEFKLTSCIPERVYNLADKAGGYRFYTRLQLISKLAERPTLSIAGSPAAEVDLKSCHMAILSALITGKPYDHTHDYYGVTLAHLGKPNTPENRIVVKLMTNTALNAANATQTVRAYHTLVRDLAVREEKRKVSGKQHSELIINLREHSDALLGWQRDPCSGLVLSKELETVDLLQAITESHADVAHCFASDVGVRCMAIESAIMRSIIGTLWNRPPDFAKCPILPVHDGALVPAYMQGAAEHVMAKSFDSVVARFDASDLFSN